MAIKFKKGPNWKSIGDAFEKKVKEQVFEKQGFIVEQARRQLSLVPREWDEDGKPTAWMPRSKTHDFWETFDLICLNGKMPPYTWLISCTVGTYTRMLERRHKIEAMMLDLAPMIGQRVQLWQRSEENKQMVRIFELKHARAGWTERLFDFREQDVSTFMGVS